MYTNQADTTEVQENRIEYFQEKGGRQFTDNGRGAEITVDLVLLARAKMSENKVNGPEDAVVSEMIKQFPMEKIYTITKCFQERFMDQMEAPSSWKIVKLVFLRKLYAQPKKGIHCADIGDVEVVCVLYCSLSGKGKRTRELEEITRGRS